MTPSKSFSSKSVAVNEAGLPPYVDIIHGKPTWSKEQRVAPVLQIHGSVKKASTIVLSREGYRRLLHSAPYYQDFLKSIVLSRTILYMGYSFTDEYLNEVDTLWPPLAFQIQFI